MDPCSLIANRDDVEANAGTGADNYAILVGIRSHESVARLLRLGPLPTDRLELVTLISTVVRDVFADHSPHKRQRAMLTEVRSYVSCYMQMYAPSSPWQFINAEVPVSGGRIDLVFRNAHTHEIMADELKFGFSRSVTARTLQQVTRYLAAGVELWGTSFVGLRLCHVASPSTSRFFAALGGGHSVPLFRTEYAPPKGAA